ncbi:MAG: hypothetical protein M3Z75_21255 [Actinomycetota bacterium]|nr:hypothetical protein [Actinomycetota bacterium]
MVRRSVLSPAVVLSGIAAVTLGLTGCKVQVPAAAASGPAAVQAAPGPSGVTRAGSLIVEPGAGFSPVYHLISDARHSIDVTMYEFADTTAQTDLALSFHRGVGLERRA